jgi:hypothetical protein
MRYTAAPIERLRSILASLCEGAEAPDQCLLRARATKVQHLCLEIDTGACAGRFTPPSDLDEARHVIEIALGFLADPKIAARPPVGLIYSIYVCAVAVSEFGRRSAAAHAE